MKKSLEKTNHFSWFTQNIFIWVESQKANWNGFRNIGIIMLSTDKWLKVF